MTKSQNIRKSGGLATSISHDQKVLYGAAVGLVAFSATALAVTSITQTKSDATTSTIGTTLDATGYYLTVTSPDELTIPVLNTTEDGVQNTISGVVNVKTNTNGYGLYLASSSTSDASLVHESSSSVKIPTTSAVDGTLSMNSWGYSMTGEGDAHFFKAVPVSGEDVEIAKVDPSASHVRGTISDDDYDITFGVRANLAQSAGTYSGDVIFTVLSEGNDAGTETASSSPSVVYLDDDSTTITVVTSLMTTMDYGTVTVTVGGQACTNVNATKDATQGTMTVTCTAPKNLDAWASYDIVVSVPKFSKTYTVSNGATYRYSKNATIFGIAYMQQMTPDLCAQTQTPDVYVTGSTTNFVTTKAETYEDAVAGGSQVVPQFTLTDMRDGNTYLIQKLADGNCWMEQNLELDFLGEAADGNGVDANGFDSFTNIINSTKATKIKQEYKFDENGNVVATPGQYATSLTSDTSNVSSDVAVSNFWTTQKSYSGSTNYNMGWCDYGTTNASDTNTDYSHSAGNADKKCGAGPRSFSTEASALTYSHSVISTPGDDTKVHAFTTASSGEPYQRYANLYNWYAATAGTFDYSGTTANAPDSICPAGWQLPVNSGNKSFNKLINTTYGLKNGNNADTSLGTAAYANFNKLVSEPLNFYRTGYYYRGNGYLASRTTTGFWWSSTTYSESRSRFLYSYTGNARVYAQDGVYKGIGCAVRCVAE